MQNKLILLRHGESTWNLENRFTGWTDVDLTKNGENEANKAGVLLSNNRFPLLKIRQFLRFKLVISFNFINIFT